MYIVSTIGKDALPDVNESGLFNYPCGICEVQNVLYVVDKNNNAIRKIDDRKQITTVFKGLNNPTSIIFVNGNFYVSDTGNNRILKINGNNFTVIRSFSGFNSPMGLTHTGYNYNSRYYHRIYVADTGNRSIKEIKDEDDTVSLFYNTNSPVTCVYATKNEGGYGTINLLAGSGVFIIYIRKNTLPSNAPVENFFNGTFLRIDADSTKTIMTISGKQNALENKTRIYVSTIKTNVLRIFDIDYPTSRVGVFSNPVFIENIGASSFRYIDGIKTSATFSYIKGSFLHSCISDDGNIYISDSSYHVIRKFDPSTRFVSTYAGVLQTPGLKDDSLVEFKNIYGISIDKTNNVYVSDNSLNTYFKITQNENTNLFLENYIQTIPLLFNDDNSYYVIETGGNMFGVSYGIYKNINGNVQNFNTVVINNNRDINYLCVINSNTIDKIYVVCSTFSNDQNTYIVELTNSNQTIISSTSTNNFGVLDGPNCITYDNKRNVIYIADSKNHRILKLNLTTRTFNTIAGTGISGFNDGTANSAQFNNPCGVFYDKNTDILYIVDTNNNRIRSIELSAPLITVKTIAGNGNSGYDDGINATFVNPKGITLDSYGNIYISQKDRVRKIINLSYKNYGRGILHNNDLYIPNMKNNEIIKIQNINSNNPIQSSWVNSSLNGPTSLLINGTNMYVTNVGDNTIKVIQNFETSTNTITNLNITQKISNADYLDSLDFPSSMISIGDDLYVTNSGNNTLVKIENFNTQIQKTSFLLASGEINKFLLKTKEVIYFDPNNQPTNTNNIRFYFKKNIQPAPYIKFSSETIYFKISSSSYDSNLNRTFIIGNFIKSDDDNVLSNSIVFPQPSSISESEYSWDDVLLGYKTVLTSQTYTLDNPTDIDIYGSDLYVTNLGSRDRNSFIKKIYNITNFKNFISNADRFLGGKLYGMKIYKNHIYASTLNFVTGVTRVIRFKINPWAGSYIFATNESSGGTYNDIIPDNSIVSEIYISETSNEMYLQVYKFSGDWEIIKIKNYI